MIELRRRVARHDVPVPDPVPDAQPPAAPGALPPQSMRRNASLSFITQLTTAGLTMVLTLFLVRQLSPHGFGLFALAMSISSLVLLPSDFGINNAAARLVAERREDIEAVRELFVAAVRLKILVSGVFCVGLAVAAGPIASAYDAPGLAWPVRALALAVFGQSLLGLFGTTAVALGRTGINLRVVALESVLELGASVGLVLAGGGAAGASFGRAIGYIVGSALGLALVLRFIGRPRNRLPRGTTRKLGREIAPYASSLLLIDGAFTLYGQIDVLLVGGFLGTTAVAVFQVPNRLLTFLHYPGVALADGIAPRYASRDAAADPSAMAAGLRGIMLLQAALIVPTIVWARPITDLLLGSAYHKAAAVLAALAPLGFMQGLGPLVSLSVNYSGAAARRIPIAIFTLVVDAIIGVILIPRIGVVGGAISSDVGYTFYVGAHLWICKQLFGLRLLPLTVTFARVLLAGGAMAGVLFAFGTHHLGVVDWIAGGAAGLAAYVVVLLAVGEVRLSELRALRP